MQSCAWTHSRRTGISESRQFTRYPVEAAIELLRDDQVLARGRTDNLSRGGIAAVIDASVQPGLSIELRMTLVFDADTFSEPLQLPARVVWCTSIGDKHQLGTSFVGLTADQLSYLEMFIRYLEEGAAAADEADPSTNGVGGGDLFSS